MLPYTDITKGKLLDYTEDRIFRIETWALQGYIFKAIWFTKNDTYLPSTIQYSKAS